jgi:hypothetical protein
MHSGPRYVIYVDQDEEERVMMTAPLAERDRRYFTEGIIPALRPMSDEEYKNGPMVVLHTMAKFSYVLHDRDVYWCVEWQPGLIVVRFSPGGTFAAAALRSPNPGFGGREPTEEDLANYDEDAENPQYNLIFDAWDAQFDSDTLKWNGFERAGEEAAQIFDAAMAHVQELGEQMEARYGGKSEEIDLWRQRCHENIQRWAGEGVRIAR